MTFGRKRAANALSPTQRLAAYRPSSTAGVGYWITMRGGSCLALAPRCLVVRDGWSSVAALVKACSRWTDVRCVGLVALRGFVESKISASAMGKQRSMIRGQV